MWKVFRSNRVELLADVLASRVQSSRRSPLEPLTIAVTSKAWRQWMQRALADRVGVAANLQLPLVREAIEMLLRQTCGSDCVLLGAEHYGLAVLAELSSGARETAEALSGLPDALRDDAVRVSGAKELGELFDAYNWHRPQQMRSWSQGEDAHWQAQLWREANRRWESTSSPPTRIAPHAAWERLLERSRWATQAEDEGQRLLVFVPATATPLQISALRAASAWWDVELYLLESSPAYWGDIRGRRDIGVAPRLVVGWGKAERELREFVEEQGEYEEPAGDLFEVPFGATLLAELQRHTLGQDDSLRGEKFELLETDHSIEIHSCPGKLREVEIVRELVWEELCRGTRPEDILVLAPDMAVYAPFVEAVFGTSDGRGVIPFNLGGQRAKGSSTVVEVASSLLSLSASRLGAQELVDFLWIPFVREHFGLGESDLETLRELIEAAAIRFGLDAEHRASHGFGHIRSNTLEFGIERLLMGYAVAQRDASSVCGIAPAGVASGDEARVLGAFAKVVETLGTHLSQLAGSHTMRGWQHEIMSALEAFVGTDSSVAAELRGVRETLDRLVTVAQEAGFDETIDAATARALIVPKIVNSAARREHFRAGVEFASLGVAAGIPARVVFVMGMNDGETPRPASRSALDLMRLSPRLLDPNPRVQDMRDMLAVLLGVRQRLVLTYCGTSLHDGMPRSPSVLVEDIVEAAAEAVRFCPKQLRRRLVVIHPLSRFHRSYFDGDPSSRVFSSSELDRACAAASDAKKETWRAWHRPLETGAGAAGGEIVSLAEIPKVLASPLSHLWTRVLGADLPRGAVPSLPGYEPVHRDALVEFDLREVLLKDAIGSADLSETVETLLARGVLPPGELGRARCEELLVGSRRLAQVTQSLAFGAPLPDAMVELNLVGSMERFVVVGILRNLRRRGLLEFTSSRSPARLLHAWIRHLALCASDVEGSDRCSAFVRRSQKDAVEVWTMPPLESPVAMAKLTALCELVRLAQKVPLRMFIPASYAFAKARFEGKTDAAAWESARTTWQPDRPVSGGLEVEKKLARLLLGSDAFELLEQQPMAPQKSFVECCELVFGPMFELCSLQIEDFA